MICIWILFAWLLADFITGIVHWWQDRYLTSRSRGWLKQIAADNELHHARPTAMLLHGWWVNIRSSARVAWPLAIIMWIVGVHWVLCSAVAFAAFGNLIHRWSHTPSMQLPRFVRGMQELGLFLSRDHHDSHHRNADGLVPKSLASQRYCAMTDWLNPILDRLRLFHWLEVGLSKLGIRTVQP